MEQNEWFGRVLPSMLTGFTVIYRFNCWLLGVCNGYRIDGNLYTKSSPDILSESQYELSDVLLIKLIESGSGKWVTNKRDCYSRTDIIF